MEQTAEQEAPNRRISLTKTQRQSAAGAELISLCQVVTTDGSLTDEEVSSLQGWLQEHKNEDLPAIAHLTKVVETIVADGRVTAEERRELYIALETALPPDVRAIARRTRRSVEEQEKDRLRVQRELEKEQQRDERERNSAIEHWDFMVAGSRYEGRPGLIQRYAQTAAPAYLVRDLGNKYSRNAVEVRTTSGHQIGFVPEEDAADLAPLLDGGHPYRAQIKKILTGGRFPIPVVVADVYRKDAAVPQLVDPAASVPRASGGAAGNSGANLVKVALIVIAVLLVLYWLA
ncbi:MAG: hypothetical protein EPO27_15930 [Betaproteobacteria bacterium]|nr:MAG: hypothetical protein EPO27_15930 [Betaproteobacteria bacterium]